MKRLGLIVLPLAIATAAQATPSLDQVNIITPGRVLAYYQLPGAWQTFTPGLTGLLSNIYLQASYLNAGEALNIYAGGISPSSPLPRQLVGTGTYIGTDFVGLAAFTTTAYVTAGLTYTFETTFRDPAGDFTGIVVLGGDTYEGGFFGGGGPGIDSGFITYVDTARQAPGPLAPVPEPATWAMMLLGVGAIGGAMRRRRALRFA